MRNILPQRRMGSWRICTTDWGCNASSKTQLRCAIDWNPLSSTLSHHGSTWQAMNSSDPLLRLLTDFFNLPPDTPSREITQQAVPSWDSLAMVQLIADLEGTFSVQFHLDEIDVLRSYDEIHCALSRKGISFTSPAPSPS